MELPLVAFAVLLVRPGMLMVATPFLGGSFAPAPTKIGLVALIGLALLPIVPLPPLAHGGEIFVVVAREAAIGLGLAMAARTVVAGAEFAGQLTGFQVGFTYASLIDPQSGVRNTTLSALYSSLAVFVFLAADGHHALLRVLVETYRTLPIGAGGIDRDAVSIVSRILGTIFVFGLQLSAPVLLVLLLLEISMGLLSRVAPSLNLSVFGFPIRLVVGLLAVAVTLRALPALVTRAIEPALSLALAAAGAFR